MRRDRPTRPTQRKGGGHAQDIARERQQSPPQKRTRPPPRRSEGWNEWATPTWSPTEEQTRERCQTPEGEGPSKEGRTLADSLTQWGHSKRAGSPRAPRESSGRGRSLTRRRSLQAQKTTCWQEAVQSRWTWKWTYGQWSTMERSNNLRRPAASARITWKEGASSCRAQRGASNQGSNPIRQDLG